MSNFTQNDSWIKCFRDKFLHGMKVYFHPPSGEGALEGKFAIEIENFIAKELADARKEVEKKVEELRKTGDFGGEGVMEILDMTSEDLMDGFKDYNQAIDDVLATLREEEVANV